MFFLSYYDSRLAVPQSLIYILTAGYTIPSFIVFHIEYTILPLIELQYMVLLSRATQQDFADENPFQ